MKKKILGFLMAGCLGLSSLAATVTVYADGQKVVTLGADLTQDQKNAVLKYFGVLGQNISTLTITNQDERNHLGSYVPLEQIGTHTFSCALVCPTTSGGIQVKTANLSWVTSNMIATTLSTSGVVNCDVLAASPFEVSGTGALTGIIMAYESASGQTLDPVKKDLATQEMITTANLANEIGQQQATSIVNEIKIQVIEGQVVEPEEVEEIVDDVVSNEVEVSLSDEDRAILTGLMTQIAEQGYNYDEMKDTLQRVENNVETLNGQVEEISQQTSEIAGQLNETDAPVQTADASAQTDDEAEPETLDSSSILMNTDDSALGEGVEINATNDEAVQQDTQPVPAETAADSNDGFEITTSDSYTDGSVQQPTEVPVDEQQFTDAPIGEQQYTEAPVDEQQFTEAPVDEQQFTEAPVDEQPLTEAPVDETTAELTLGAYYFEPNSNDGYAFASGMNEMRMIFADSNLIPVSGNITITDAFGNTCSVIDVANSDNILARPADQSVLQKYGLSSGTEFVILANTCFDNNQQYTVSCSFSVAAADNPAAAQIAADYNFNTDNCGLVIEGITKVSDIQANSTLYGSMILNDLSYAEISDYDSSMISLDKTEFTPEDTSLTINCLQSGSTTLTIDFYSEDGSLYGTFQYPLNIQ